MNKNQQTPPPSGNNGYGAPEVPQMKHTDKSLAQILPGAGKLTRVSMELSQSLRPTQWRDLGIALGQLDGVKQWWIGDWWAHGHKYGERKAMVEHIDWEGPSYGTCANAASVCRAFETSRRREVLSFQHHQELATLVRAGRLTQEQADELLNWCEEPLKEGKKYPRSVRALLLEIVQRDNRKIFAGVIRTLDERIQQRCENASEEKVKAFKAEIAERLERICEDIDYAIRAVDLEMVAEKLLNDKLGAPPEAPLKLIEFIKPFREWCAHSTAELDEIVAVVPIKRAGADLRVCRIVIDELQFFASKLAARMGYRWNDDNDGYDD